MPVAVKVLIIVLPGRSMNTSRMKTQLPDDIIHTRSTWQHGIKPAHGTFRRSRQHRGERDDQACRRARWMKSGRAVQRHQAITLQHPSASAPPPPILRRRRQQQRIDHRRGAEWETEHTSIADSDFRCRQSPANWQAQRYRDRGYRWSSGDACTQADRIGPARWRWVFAASTEVIAVVLLTIGAVPGASCCFEVVPHACFREDCHGESSPGGDALWCRA